MIAICILFILVIFKPNISGYTDNKTSIFDLDEFSWIPGIYDIRDLVNDDFIVNLKSLTANYNSGNYQRLTPNDYTHLVEYFNKMLDSFNAQSIAPLSGDLIPPPGSNVNTKIKNAVAQVNSALPTVISSSSSSSSSAAWWTLNGLLTQKKVWIPLVVVLVLLIIGVAVAMSSNS